MNAIEFESIWNEAITAGLAAGQSHTPNASFKGSRENALICLKEKHKWIGQKVTIYYNGLTGLGIPNFAQFDYNNSIKGDR
jgi:hypothetical protein